MDPSSIAVVAAKYRRTFMEEVGGCTVPEGKRRKVVKGSARDLFCFGDEREDEWEDDWVVAGQGPKQAPVADNAAAKTSGVVAVAAAQSAEAVVRGTPTPSPGKKLASGVRDI